MQRIFIGLAILAGGCTTQAATPPLPEPGETIAQQQQTVAYGGAGILSESQAATLRGLAWPQTYSDMKGTFGLPNQRTEAADIYKLVNGSEIRVIYEGTEATGLEVP